MNYRVQAALAIRLVKPNNASDRLLRAARAFDAAKTRRERSEALVWLEEALKFERGVTVGGRKAIIAQLSAV